MSARYFGGVVHNTQAAARLAAATHSDGVERELGVCERRAHPRRKGAALLHTGGASDRGQHGNRQGRIFVGSAACWFAHAHTHHASAREEAGGGLGDKVAADAPSAGALAEEEHAAGVAAKVGDVVLRPAQRGALVEQPEVARRAVARVVLDVCRRREAQHVQAVVGCDDHRRLRQRHEVMAPVERDGLPARRGGVSTACARRRGAHGGALTEPPLVYEPPCTKNSTGSPACASGAPGGVHTLRKRQSSLRGVTEPCHAACAQSEPNHLAGRGDVHVGPGCGGCHLRAPTGCRSGTHNLRQTSYQGRAAVAAPQAAAAHRQCKRDAQESVEALRSCLACRCIARPSDDTTSCCHVDITPSTPGPRNVATSTVAAAVRGGGSIASGSRIAQEPRQRVRLLCRVAHYGGHLLFRFCADQRRVS